MLPLRGWLLTLLVWGSLGYWEFLFVLSLSWSRELWWSCLQHYEWNNCQLCIIFQDCATMFYSNREQMKQKSHRSRLNVSWEGSKGEIPSCSSTKHTAKNALKSLVSLSLPDSQSKQELFNYAASHSWDSNIILPLHPAFPSCFSFSSFHSHTHTQNCFSHLLRLSIVFLPNKSKPSPLNVKRGYKSSWLIFTLQS